MKKLIGMMCLLPLPCWSQAITGIVANPKTANIGEDVTFTVNLAVPPDTEPRCGLSVVFGDGSFTDSPIYDRSEVPFVISHKYSTPGTYGIRVEGKFLWRAPFRSVGACDGSSNIALNVVDKAAKEAEVQAAKEREQAAKEREQAAKELEERAANAERAAQEAEERAAKERERAANAERAAQEAEERAAKDKAAKDAADRAAKDKAAKDAADRAANDKAGKDKAGKEAADQAAKDLKARGNLK